MEGLTVALCARIDERYRKLVLLTAQKMAGRGRRIPANRGAQTLSPGGDLNEPLRTSKDI